MEPIRTVTSGSMRRDSFGDDQILVKIKSKSYLAMHHARFLMTPKNVRELLDRERIRDMDQLRRALGADADWEILSWYEPFVSAYDNALSDADSRLAEMDAFLLTLAMRCAGDRKALAREVMAQLPDWEVATAFLLADGKEDEARDLLRSRFVDRAFEPLTQPDSEQVTA